MTPCSYLRAPMVMSCRDMAPWPPLSTKLLPCKCEMEKLDGGIFKITIGMRKSVLVI